MSQQTLKQHNLQFLPQPLLLLLLPLLQITIQTTINKRIDQKAEITIKVQIEMKGKVAAMENQKVKMEIQIAKVGQIILKKATKVETCKKKAENDQKFINIDICSIIFNILFNNFLSLKGKV